MVISFFFFALTQRVRYPLESTQLRIRSIRAYLSVIFFTDKFEKQNQKIEKLAEQIRIEGAISFSLTRQRLTTNNLISCVQGISSYNSR